MNHPIITDTVLVIGASPFVGTVDLPALLNLGLTTFGVNDHPHKMDYTAFVDDCMAEIHMELSGTIITHSRHAVREPVIHFDEFGYDFTHDYILKWLHGRCTRAILVGAADFDGYDEKANTCHGEHYHSDEIFSPDLGAIRRSIKFIEGIREIELFKVNPKGVLKIPAINFNDILKLKKI